MRPLATFRHIVGQLVDSGQKREHATSETTVQGNPGADSGGTRPRLLIVDDDRQFLEIAERLFSGEDYLPICTDAPRSAMQIARTVQPVAIFLDILMPDFDGWDVLAALKADPVTAGIPVFMTSVLSERRRAMAAGAEGIVLKPLDPAKVKAAMLEAHAAQCSSIARAVNA
ncbi:two-component system response regulator [Devosia sp. RR2S18]|uniref:response regulator n=1 Tax=Devosia rhizosphaerae TaxID=3049774 RepID=UPI00254028F0|nr:response regulator [Devosia sp. RR2S18]WIJ26180.1 response regulator [Devosia sp. RR2S18]